MKSLLGFFLIFSTQIYANNLTTDCKKDKACCIPPHIHTQYVEREELDEKFLHFSPGTHDHDGYALISDLEKLKGELANKKPAPIVKMHPRPKGDPHCTMSTYMEHVVYNGRCSFDDVMVGFVNGHVICARTIIRCNTDALLKVLKP
jgi:hypothetical protein